MSKKIIALNGSGRAHGNSGSMLDACIDGIHAIDETIEVERINLFDLDYKGCRGCHGCELKTRKEIGCIQRDGAAELLKQMRKADGILFATPVFFWELSAQLRALLERYIYPGALDHHQEIGAIYTMYQPERVSKLRFTPHVLDVQRELLVFLKDVNYSELIVNDTQSWKSGTGDRYFGPNEAAIQRSEKFHEEQWPKDLERGRQFGEEFAKRLGE